MNRRGFARTLLTAALAGSGLPRVLRAQSPREKAGLRIAMAFPVIDPLFSKGWELGVNEARRSASPFNVSLESVTVQLKPTGQIRELVSQLKQQNVTALGSCTDDRTTRSLAEALSGTGIIHFNCGSRSDALRREFCAGGTLHVEASDAMYDAARKLSLRHEVELWDSRLERFGAAQLNDRFRAFSGKPMNATAWAGWFAVKALIESHLRAPGDVAGWIASDTAQFDGHKGAPLSFRPWDGQLRQPLYALGPHIIDVPDITRSDRPAREILDTIGDTREMRSCSSLR